MVTAYLKESFSFITEKVMDMTLRQTSLQCSRNGELRGSAFFRK